MLYLYVQRSSEWDDVVVSESVREYTEGLPSVDYTKFNNKEYFGSVGRAMFSLFQIMTFDHWMTNILRYLTDHPFAVIYNFIFKHRKQKRARGLFYSEMFVL